MALADKIVEINKLRKEFEDSFALDFLNENEKLWKKFRLEWNYNSNHIEGNTLTYGETELLLFFDKTTGDHEKREYDEMQAHDVAIHLIKDWAKNSEREITEADIRELNKTILVKPFWKEAITQDGQSTRRLIDIGEYKKHPNSVRLKNGEMFHYASPQETPQLMTDLMSWYRKNDIQHAIILAADLHYKFIRIHPFDDGNGRIARLLVNYVLMKNGYPPIIIKSKEKDKYITALNKADTGDISAFHEYMAEQLIWSLELTIKAAKGENIEEDDDLDKELEILSRELKAGKIKTEPRSAHSLLTVSNNLIFPLITEIENKIIAFNEYFYQTERYFGYQKVDSNSTLSLGNAKSSLSQIQKSFCGKIETEKIILSKIDYEYQLIGFKQNEKGSSLSLNIRCSFDDFNYTLKLNNQNDFKFPYIKEFTEKEIKDFSKQIIKDVMSDIKRLRELNN